MPEATLRDTVLKRLDAAAGDDNDWYPLVLAALEGAQELEKLLDEGGGAEAPASAARHPDGGFGTAPEGLPKLCQGLFESHGVARRGVRPRGKR
jgi:hypothetical protein